MSMITASHELPSLQPPMTPVGVGTAAVGEGIGLGDVVRVLKQRKILIIVVSFLVYVLVVAATFLTLKYAPTYTSEALFELEPPKTSGDSLVGNEDRFDARNMDLLLKTEARKLVQLDLLFNVVEQQIVKDTEYYRWYESDAMKCATGLADDLSVGPIPDTRLIRIALTCKKKKEAQLIVQTITERYRAQFVEDVEGELTSQLKSLKDTLGELNKTLETKQAELNRVRETSEIPAMEAARVSSKDFVAGLRTDLAGLEARAASLEAQMQSVSDVPPDQLPLTTEDQLIIESDPILRYWRQQVENLDVEIRTSTLRLGDNHRDVRALKRRRDENTAKETSKREELISQVRLRRMESLRQELAQTRNVQARLQDQLEEAEARERDLDRNLQRYESLKEEHDRLTHRIAKVEDDITQTEHRQRDKTRIALRLVQPPKEAVEPTRPKLLTWLAGGFLLSIFAGVGLAFIREFTDKAVRTPIDVARHGRISVLGSIPQIDDEEANVEDIERAVRLAPNSLVAEAFRKVRANWQFSGPEETQRTLLITSPSRNDGKTTIAINLAVTLAHGGQRTLLIDCNFRRPALRQWFANTREEGLSNILVGKGTLAEIVTPTELPNLDVLTSGPLPPTPAELLGSHQMRELLAEATKRYAHVILDGPPVLLMSDAGVLATLVDGVILVARAEENTKGSLKRARETLDAISARVLGAVLNGVRARAGGYFREHYREFYEYTSDETIAELPSPVDSDKRSDA